MTKGYLRSPDAGDGKGYLRATDPEAEEVQPSSSGAAEYPKKKRHIVRVGNQLLVFASQADALNSLPDEPQKYPAKKKAKAATVVETPVAKPEQAVSLPQAQTVAAMYGEQQQYSDLLRKQHFEALIALIEKLQAQEDEDIEILLMAA